MRPLQSSRPVRNCTKRTFLRLSLFISILFSWSHYWCCWWLFHFALFRCLISRSCLYYSTKHQGHSFSSLLTLWTLTQTSNVFSTSHFFSVVRELTLHHQHFQHSSFSFIFLHVCAHVIESPKAFTLPRPPWHQLWLFQSRVLRGCYAPFLLPNWPEQFQLWF